MDEKVELSVVIPALNEEKTLGLCLKKAMMSIKRLGVRGEVIVADNGSSDRTAGIAEEFGARLVKIHKRGFGNACLGGLRAAKGQFLIMADADDSYNFDEIDPFFRKLKEGYEFVIGNRFQGKIEPGAMPFLHRYLGTPVLTWLMNLFFRIGVGDVNCGMRGMTKRALSRMHLRTEGMEFTTEIVIKAGLVGLKIAELPCNLYRDKRNRRPHLKTWSDGWRYLRFMLLFTPTWTLLIPGLTLTLLGLAGMGLFFSRDIFHFDIFSKIGGKHILSAMLVFLTGCQILQLGVIAKAFSFSKRFDHRSRVMHFLSRSFSLERGLLSGLALMITSALTFLYLQVSFYTGTLPRLTDPIRLDLAVFAIAFFLLGIQFVFSSFVLSLFYLKVK